ncbi:hypothetical protein Cyast_2219 [Cyanobacterium stanieri PCC 7202]|uniref:Methylmalonic aciduria and homocystinuria type D protein n=1 Tax=Cyanobacterium stanieri (strain ATCC 29140 / PCC 7202) TaxID=292563 RepID=K9YPZ0_CYASC|nr:hypothetical protein Cyast_2219 [Cyanobacterium stanieri PCC 7202]
MPTIYDGDVRNILIKDYLAEDLEIYFRDINFDDYLIINQKNLLPSWEQKIKSLGFFLFKSQVNLVNNSLAEEQEKERLLRVFLLIGRKIYNDCQLNKTFIEVISSDTGLPIYSKKGTDFFSLPLLIERYLNKIKRVDNCCGLSHPHWGRAMYPCLIVSSASCEKLREIININAIQIETNT